MMASDKDLETKLIWRAECGATYMGHDAKQLLNLLRTEPVTAWELLERTSGIRHLLRTKNGARIRRRKTIPEYKKEKGL